MKNRNLNVFFIFILVVFSVLSISYLYRNMSINIKYKIEDTKIKLEQPEFFLKNPEEGLRDALVYYDIKYPNIVYAQAVLETGYFRSNVCKNYNNLFGLYNSKIGDYYKFNHWTESVESYRKYIQYKFNEDKYKPPNGYYKFLEDIGYAEDPEYTLKLRRIVEKF